METWASQAMGNAPIRVDNGMDTHAAYKHAKIHVEQASKYGSDDCTVVCCFSH